VWLEPAPYLLDTNLLLLFVVGTASREYIARHKRLTEFTLDDYDALLQITSNAPSVFVTPNTLTETSNLAAYINEPARTKVREVLRDIIASSRELYITSHKASGRDEFLRLGLTDVALIEASSQPATILTTDLDLYRAASANGAPVINFNHIRDGYL
jgi:hypothetical protein